MDRGGPKLSTHPPDDDSELSPNCLAGLEAGRRAAIEHPPTDAMYRDHVRRLDNLPPRLHDEGEQDG